MCEENNELCEGEDYFGTYLKSFLIFDMVTFSGLLLFGLYNSVKFVIKQKKWTSFFVSSFYLFVLVLAACRIAFMAVFWFWVADRDFLRWRAVEDEDTTEADKQIILLVTCL